MFSTFSTFEVLPTISGGTHTPCQKLCYFLDNPVSQNKDNVFLKKIILIIFFKIKTRLALPESETLDKIKY